MGVLIYLLKHSHVCIDFTDYTEYRCFIKNRTLLGVSYYDTDNFMTNEDKVRLIKFVKKVISELDIYNDFTADIALSKTSIFVIEINSPVYMMAGSGAFSLYDIKNVIDEKHKNINYPIFKGLRDEYD